ncbi:pheromone-regulated protein prm10 [Pleurotus ostreatus]|nr:pheromone-regulated protein prm10 [Pleurotus ostreatus]
MSTDRNVAEFPSSRSPIAPRFNVYDEPSTPRTLPAVPTARPRRSSLRVETPYSPNILSSPAQQTPVVRYMTPPQWQVPVFDNVPPSPRNGPNPPRQELPSRRFSGLAPGSNRNSDATLAETFPQSNDEFKKYSMSSYEHPYDIPAPESTYQNRPGGPQSASARRSVSFADEQQRKQQYEPNDLPSLDPNTERALKRRGVLHNMLDLYAINNNMDGMGSRQNSEDWPPPRGMSSARPGFRRMDSMVSVLSGTGSDILDPDDPRVTGVRAEYLEDREDVEKNTLREMDYRARRKHLMRARIEFNVTSMINRQEFLIKLARALMTFGAPSHRIESQLIAAARILEVEAEFIHLPGVIICSFGDQEMGCSETHFVKCGGALSLGALHKVHLIYRSVVHDEISAKKASEQLEALLKSGPVYPRLFRVFLAFLLSSLICPLAFGGSFLDMWVAGGCALVLSFLQLFMAGKSVIYANVFEITITIFISFTARGLSSIRSHLFCYTAISSSSIIGILPGYLILSSSLELASKNILCGSVKMVYALIYTLFLGFGLQIGSDFYLLFDKSMRRNLDELALNISATATFAGTWISDNTTNIVPGAGTWTFVNRVPLTQQNIHDGCFRLPNQPWYLQPFPYWTAFVIVPLFSILSSLANQQPWKSRQLPVMVVISCASYASNKVANHYIFNRSGVVSAIGAFTVGVLGNMYSRKMGGTAFTSMVTGVLFLVPSGLSQAGGITANGNGIDIGGAMIAVTIGITVGLFMSQALVYMFGTRKNAAVFSF